MSKLIMNLHSIFIFRPLGLIHWGNRRGIESIHLYIGGRAPYASGSCPALSIIDNLARFVGNYSY